jgi:hypothetical protein
MLNEAGVDFAAQVALYPSDAEALPVIDYIRYRWY